MKALAALKLKTEPIVNLIKRHQGVMALLSFFLGIASFMLVNRQNRSASVIAILLLSSWAFLVWGNLKKFNLNLNTDLEIKPTFLKFITQIIHQESVFFVLPFFIVTTTWNSGQIIFTAILCMIALLTIIDPFYYGWLSKRKALFIGFHTIVLFVVLLTSLPIIFQITTYQSYQYATIATVLLTIPSLWQVVRGAINFKAVAAILLLTASLTACLWFARIFVPPATLWITQMYVNEDIDADVDVQSDDSRDSYRLISLKQLHAKGLYAYSAIRAPRGLAEEVFHVWKLDGVEVDRIGLLIEGGRQQGYRTWSHKEKFPENSIGDWQVQVVTAGGQLIGLLRFKVIDVDYDVN